MNPYLNQPTEAFWGSAIKKIQELDFSKIYTPKFTISRSNRIATVGSCFAQHIGREFKKRNYTFIDLEPAPEGLALHLRSKFGLDLFSARYGNVYTSRQLLQLFQRAFNNFTPVDSAWIMPNGRAFDPYRPLIEPNGFKNEREMLEDRQYHLSQVRNLLSEIDLLVFTFGLTEAWECVVDQAVLPTCPGTVAGEFNKDKYRFINLSYSEILHDMEEFISFCLTHNPSLKIILTVSPIPLIATATAAHVLCANTLSKSILRAVCGELCARYSIVDYFPSYEIFTATPIQGGFYQSDFRRATPEGVTRVMDAFFKAHGDYLPPENSNIYSSDFEDDICDEELLLERM